MLESVGRTKAARSSGAAPEPPQCPGGRRLTSILRSASGLSEELDANDKFRSAGGCEAGEECLVEL